MGTNFGNNLTRKVVNPMFDVNQLEPDARQFFESMPLMLQENLMQTGVAYKTRQELERYCDGILKGNSKKRQ